MDLLGDWMSIAGTFMVTWDLKSIGSTFMAAGIGSVAGQIYLDRRKQKKVARLLAAKLAVLLEAHTAKYAEFIEMMYFGVGSSE